MMAECKRCGSGDTVEYVPGDPTPTSDPFACGCWWCGALYVIEEDGDWDGESYSDASYPTDTFDESTLTEKQTAEVAEWRRVSSEYRAKHEKEAKR